MRRKRLLWLAPLAILGMLLFVFIGGELVMYLWNWLTPAVFGWRQITFWQALAMLALCRILFGGFGGRGLARTNVRRRMAERWERMSPEERERYRERYGRCADFAPPDLAPPGSAPSV